MYILLVLLFLWFYALTSGFSPSVVRSVFMFSLLLLAQMTGRRYSSINILFFSAFVLILINPMVFFDVGFQLSYLAMLGIFSIYPIIQNWLNFKNKIMHYFWQGTAVCLSAQCVTVPLCIYYFHQFPNYFMIANLGIMILSTLVMGIGLGIFIFHFICSNSNTCKHHSRCESKLRPRHAEPVFEKARIVLVLSDFKTCIC